MIVPMLFVVGGFVVIVGLAIWFLTVLFTRD